MSSKLILVTEAARILGVHQSNHKQALAVLAEEGVKQFDSVPYGKKKRPVFLRELVVAAAKSRAEKAAALAAKSAIAQASLPVTTPQVIDDDLVAAVTKAEEPLKEYMRHVGDNQLKMMRELAATNALLREVVLGQNRLLAAAGLKTIQVPA